MAFFGLSGKKMDAQAAVDDTSAQTQNNIPDNNIASQTAPAADQSLSGGVKISVTPEEQQTGISPEPPTAPEPPLQSEAPVIEATSIANFSNIAEPTLAPTDVTIESTPEPIISAETPETISTPDSVSVPADFPGTESTSMTEEESPEPTETLSPTPVDDNTDWLSAMSDSSATDASKTEEPAFPEISPDITSPSPEFPVTSASELKAAESLSLDPVEPTLPEEEINFNSVPEEPVVNPEVEAKTETPSIDIDEVPDAKPVVDVEPSVPDKGPSFKFVGSEGDELEPEETEEQPVITEAELEKIRETELESAQRLVASFEQAKQDRQNAVDSAKEEFSEAKKQADAVHKAAIDEAEAKKNQRIAEADNAFDSIKAIGTRQLEAKKAELAALRKSFASEEKEISKGLDSYQTK